MRQAEGSEAQARALIKKVVHRRRRSIGLLQRLPGDCWEDTKISAALQSVSEILLSCGKADWEELDQDSTFTPEDVMLAESLERLFYAVNVYESLSSMKASQEEKVTAKSERSSAGVEMTTTQSLYVAAEADYFRWRLGSDSRIGKVWQWVSDITTEEVLIRLLLNPVAQVLTLEECIDAGIDPLIQGRLVSERLGRGLVHPTPEQICFEDNDTFLRAGAPMAYEVTVKASRTSARRIKTTVLRQQERMSWVYHIGEAEVYTSIIRSTPSDELEHLIFGPLEEAEQGNYLEHPYLRVSYYADSAISQLLQLCRFLITEGFAQDESSAVRYLLMGQQEARIPFEVQGSWPWFRQGAEPLTGYYYMTIPPWAMPQQVEECWRRNRPEEGRERCLPPSTSVDLFRFILAHTPSGETPRWSHLAMRWQCERGEKMTRDKLLRTFHSVRKVFALPADETSVQE